MSSINFDFDASELIQAMEKATKQYPASAEKVLKKEAKNIAKDLQKRVNSEVKGHHYRQGKNSGDEETQKPLSESFRQGRVIRSGSKMTIAVTSSAPHYHLYELGHDMVTHNRKDRERKRESRNWKESRRSKRKKDSCKIYGAACGSRRADRTGTA